MNSIKTPTTTAKESDDSSAENLGMIENYVQAFYDRIILLTHNLKFDPLFVIWPLMTQNLRYDLLFESWP